MKPADLFHELKEVRESVNLIVLQSGIRAWPTCLVIRYGIHKKIRDICMVKTERHWYDWAIK